MQDRSNGTGGTDNATRGVKWTLGALFFGGLATVAVHPLSKIIALALAAASAGKAVNSYEAAGKSAYRELRAGEGSHPMIGQ